MLASAGYLLTMLGDCIVMFVTRSGGEGEAIVQVDEERVAQEDDKDVAMDADHNFLKTTSLGDTVLLILALCFHSVFEGIAVGVAGRLAKEASRVSTFHFNVFFDNLLSFGCSSLLVALFFSPLMAWSVTTLPHFVNLDLKVAMVLGSCPYRSTSSTWIHGMCCESELPWVIPAGTTGEAWRNLWTISLHKIFAAIGMGIALLRMLPKRPFLFTAAYSFAFAISSPIGVGIGIAIDATTQPQATDWIYAISMGLACGVFIYVAINHLIAKGYHPQAKLFFDAPFFKFVAVLLGVGVIAVVMIWD